LIAQILTALLEFVSGDNRLTPGKLDECARKQYMRHKPSANPFGDGEEAKRFAEMDVFMKVCSAGVWLVVKDWGLMGEGWID
jgi:hypothetical protein